MREYPTQEELLARAHAVWDWLKWVPGEGAADACVALVGEAPGAEEDTEGRPFVGRAGQLLNSILSKVGVSREDLYITNYVKIRPPGNVLAELSLFGIAPSDFMEILIEELAALPNLRVIVPVGGTALTALTGLSGIMTWRGSQVAPLDPRLSYAVCVPTLHPAALLRGRWEAIKDVVVDIRKALGIAHGEWRGTPAESITFIPEPHQLEELLAYLEAFKKAPAFAYDIETQFASRISVVGMYSPEVPLSEGSSTPVTLVIPFKQGRKNVWSEADELTIWYKLREVMGSSAVKITQNGVYDMAFLTPLVGLPAPPWFDTMLAHALIDPESPHDLDFLTTTYTRMSHYAGDFKDWKDGSTTVESIAKNRKDVVVTYEVFQALKADLVTLDLHRFFQGFTMPEQRAMFIASRRGAAVDHQERERLLKAAEERGELLQTRINEQIGYELNVRSPIQMNDLLYKKLKFPIQRNRKTKEATGEIKVIRRLLAYHADKHPQEVRNLLEDIISLKELKKTVSSYLSPKLFDPDGILRYESVLSGTETGRMSTRKTPFKTGLNIQTVPAEAPQGLQERYPGWARRTIVPRRGYSFMQADESQAEAVTVAYLANCTPLIELFADPEADIHSTVAGWSTGQVVPKGERHPQRKLYKKAVHGGNYGITAVAFAMELNVSVKQASEVLERYHGALPEIQAWWAALRNELIKQNRVLYTPLGRRRVFKKRMGQELFKELYAYKPQSIVADLAHHAVNKLWYIYLPKNAWIIQQSHDSVLVEYKKGRGMEERMRRVMADAFNKAVLINGKFMRVRIDIESLPERWSK
jgi:uracil-DNA glycosylase family 4